jgi:hypothetical protein
MLVSCNVAVWPHHQKKVIAEVRNLSVIMFLTFNRKSANFLLAKFYLLLKLQYFLLILDFTYTQLNNI